MSKLGISKWLAALAVGLTIIAFTPQMTFAVGDTPSEPKPKPKPKPKSKPKPKPKEPKQGLLNDDQIYSLGYWRAKDGAYAEALATLRSAKDQADPRIQTMIGFTLRKLGRVDEAMTYYTRVLVAYPDRTTTRQYLGEAYLQIGEPGKAREQLAEIAKRCGVACEDYQLLADEIAKFEKNAG
jgi:predicted Zn-dependent protease